MPFDGNDLADDAVPRGRGALFIGLLLTLLGAAILIGPLLFSMWSDPNGESIGVLIIGLPLFLFIAALFLAFGLTVLFSQVVDYGAVGAGKVRILGLEMPMEFQGAAMVLFLLLLGMGASIKLFDLRLINDDWSRWVNLHETVAEQNETITVHNLKLQSLKDEHTLAMADEVATHEAKVAVLQERIADISGRLDTSREGLVTLREVLIAQARAKGQRLKIRFRCGRNDPERRVNWTDTGSDRTGVLLTHTDHGRVENSTSLPSQSLSDFLLKFENRTTYTITSADELTSESRDVISASFYFEDENLVAEIWPNTMSLLDLCRRQDEPRTSRGDLDGQAPVIEARSWQDQVESEGNGL
jgi:hypothetical protein